MLGNNRSLFHSEQPMSSSARRIVCPELSMNQHVRRMFDSAKRMLEWWLRMFHFDQPMYRAGWLMLLPDSPSSSTEGAILGAEKPMLEPETAL